MPKVSVIVPSYNVEDYIGATIQSVLKNSIDVEIIVVDDFSTDGTFDIACSYAKQYPGITVVKNHGNLGAGVARNVGMKIATGEYLYFLDADDILVDNALDDIVKIIDKTSADLICFKYNYMTSETGSYKGMLKGDIEIWDGIIKSAEHMDVTVAKHSNLLLTVNYPWNKLVRSSFARDTGLYFSSTKVNNDIYAHWHLYMMSSKVTLYNKTLISHRVFEGRQQITNIFDERRFDAFRALADVEDLLRSNPDLSGKYFHQFCRFKLDLLKWINARLGSPLRSEFLSRVRRSYGNFTPAAFIGCFDHYPKIATDSAYLRYVPEKVLKG